MNVVDYLS